MFGPGTFRSCCHIVGVCVFVRYNGLVLLALLVELLLQFERAHVRA